MKHNHQPFGRGIQTLSFLVLSSIVLLIFAQARRYYTLHSPHDWLAVQPPGYSATIHSAPKTVIAIGELAKAHRAAAPETAPTILHRIKPSVKAVTAATFPTAPASPAPTTRGSRSTGNLTTATTTASRPSRTLLTTTASASGIATVATSASRTTTSAVKLTTTSKTTTSTVKSITTAKTTTSTAKSTTTSKTTASTVKSTTTSKTTTSTAKSTTTSKTATTTSKDNSAVPTNQSGDSPYYIVVYKGSQSTVVYGKDNSGNYTRVIKTFTCSTGKSSSPTRIGTYHIRAKYRWRWLVGGVYGQWNSSISSDYLFHSVPYYRQDASTLENEEYDKLGSPASKGCIRMCVRDCKWIYDNCPIGTEVNIVNQSGPAGPGVPRRKTDEAYSGWDPSDRWTQGNPYFA